jgi:hypothetical protein
MHFFFVSFFLNIIITKLNSLFITNQVVKFAKSARCDSSTASLGLVTQNLQSKFAEDDDPQLVSPTTQIMMDNEAEQVDKEEKDDFVITAGIMLGNLHHDSGSVFSNTAAVMLSASGVSVDE